MGYGWIGYIIVGAIIGALARLFMKGEQNMGIIWTIILGALGAGIGGTLTGYLGADSSGVIAWIVSIIVAMILISLYLGFAGKRR